MMQVRPATERDVTWMLGELRQFAAFTGVPGAVFPATDEDARKLLLGYIDKCPFFVAELMHPDIPNFGRPVGFILGFLTPLWSNPTTTVLSEALWWVSPDYRGTRAGALLLLAFERVGKEHADWVVITLEEKSPINPATLERRGFRAFERSYLLEADVLRRSDRVNQEPGHGG